MIRYCVYVNYSVYSQWVVGSDYPPQRFERCYWISVEKWVKAWKPKDRSTFCACAHFRHAPLSLYRGERVVAKGSRKSKSASAFGEFCSLVQTNKQTNKHLHCRQKESRPPMCNGKNRQEKQFSKYARNTIILILISKFLTSKSLPSILALLRQGRFRQPIWGAVQDEMISLVYVCTGDQRRHFTKL